MGVTTVALAVLAATPGAAAGRPGADRPATYGWRLVVDRATAGACQVQRIESGYAVVCDRPDWLEAGGATLVRVDQARCDAGARSRARALLRRVLGQLGREDGIVGEVARRLMS